MSCLPDKDGDPDVFHDCLIHFWFLWQLHPIRLDQVAAEHHPFSWGFLPNPACTNNKKLSLSKGQSLHKWCWVNQIAT